MTANRPAATLRSPLGLRLVAAFVAVAVAAVFVLAGLTLWRTKHTVSQLAGERQQATADAIAQTFALAYEQNGGWLNVDSHPAMMLAAQAGAGLIVLDVDGMVVELQSSSGNMHTTKISGDGPERRAEIVVNGDTVGTVVVMFVSGELALAEMHVRDALRGTVLIGALVAAFVALVVAILLARRIIRPLRRVTDAVRRLGEGDSTARVGDHDAPGEIGTLATTFDSMAERLTAHETVRRNLTADVAHELRTPLTLLQGNCEEIIDGITEPTLDRFVQMHDDVLRLRRLVDDLDILADADAATTEHDLRRERCDLAVIAARVADSMTPMINAHQHQLQQHLRSVFVDGDPARLGQVVTNLLSNAIKYTAPGGHLVIEVQPSVDQRTAILSVADDGPGIDTEDRPHIFERFYRAESARAMGGSGIGLAVAHQLVTAHHGHIDLAPTMSGATIVVTLPVHTDAH
ncbi:MAG: sensor histidine kinase [Ilumatobacteraceae bacterium]